MIVTQNRAATVPDPGPAGRANVVPILRSGVLAQEFCRRHTVATVEAVFERSFYLRSGDEFICVGEPDIGNGPLTLIGHLRPLSDLALQPRQPVAVCDRAYRDRQFHSADPGPERDVAFSVLARLPVACPFDRHLRRPRTAHRNRCTGGRPCAPALAFGVWRNVRASGPLARIARPRIAMFERWLSGVLDKHAQVTESRDAVQGLIGLGPGLTPSGDDFLVGALALLDCVGERDAHAALARAIIAALPGSTSPLSACFLRAAAAAHVGETLHRAVSSVIAGDVDAAIAAVETIGHSSGWDMMAGITATLRVAAAARADAFVCA